MQKEITKFPIADGNKRLRIFHSGVISKDRILDVVHYIVALVAGVNKRHRAGRGKNELMVIMIHQSEDG